jgi:hypothetical protein
MMTFIQILGAAVMIVGHGYISAAPDDEQSRDLAGYIMLAGAAILVGVSFFKYVM